MAHYQYVDQLLLLYFQCGISIRGLLLFRMFAAAFHWLILVLRFSETERLPPFCYLTNLVYLCCASYYTLAVYNSLRVTNEASNSRLFQSMQVFRMDKVCYEEKPTEIQVLYAVQWLLHAVILNLSILISIMYFSLIYDPTVDRLGLTNIGRHVLNSVFILVEFSFNSIPVKLVHLVWGVVFSLLYAVYTVIFWYTVGPPENYIYKVINWDKPFPTIKLIFLLIFAAFFIKLVLLMLSKLKFHVSGSCNNPSLDQTFLV